ncbi:hypothetical protein L3X38_024281 [Prunus dulcis]|uniref:Transposable element protein n=1 Tax=Prunus dulcis TaxID=3755 RepID=A0AAD4Z6V7_PRUDU|nr:hypothetical protein L3X38_024281 [Prunus dulcis]
MDKSWMHSDRRSKAYEFGVEAFLNFAVQNFLTTTHIRCPCVKCVNLKLFGVGIIRDHVYFNGADQSYKNWTFHGEPWEATTNASRNVEEDDGHSKYSFVSEEIDMDDNDFGDFGSDPYEFANVIGDGDQPVYPGCRKYTKLSALVKLYNLKAKHGMSDVGFTKLLILQGNLEKPARYAITRLCFFFNAICAKTVDVSKLDKLEEDVVVTLCLLEKYFPPSLFDIMVHLVVHLVREVRLCGPVYFRWMYSFERYMKVLKGYVQNRTRPEGCIAERYIAEEAVEFCTQHLSDVSTVGVPSSEKMGVSKPLSGCTNTEEVLPYIEQHMIHIKTAYPKFRKRTKWLQDKHNSSFIQWLRFKVQSELEEDNHGVSENLRWLAAGQNMAVPLYRNYLIKGIKFNIKAQDDVRTTQNSGVYLLAHTMQVASAKDKNPILSNMGFYGVIQEIWDLDYQKFTIPVFREYNDVIGDEVLGDVIIECEPFTRGMPNVDTFDELVGELGGQNIRDGCEDIWIE